MIFKHYGSRMLVAKNAREIKKVELHRHMEGSIRLETLIDAAALVGVKLPTTDLKELRRHALVLEPMRDLLSVLNKFWLFQSVLGSPEVIKRMAYENVIDAYNDGIRVLELRYAPAFISKGHSNLTYEMIHAAVCEGVTQAEEELGEDAIAVGLICILNRDIDHGEAEKTLDFILKYRDTFVGLDLAGDELASRSTVYKKHFLRAKREGVKITVHAGEANVPLAPQFVRESILELGALRIGHGVQIIHDQTVIDLVRERGIVLELCPTSNVLTNAVPSIKDHPIRKLREMGVKVTLNSDDPHIFGIDLTHEYEVLRRELKFSDEEFAQMNETALKASFIPEEKKNRVWRKAMGV
jgi:adenosine deaminase